MDYQHLNLGNVSWKHYLRETFERHTRERVIPSHSHADTCVFESRTTQHSKQFTLNPTLRFRRQSCSDPDDQQRTKPKLKVRHKNAQSRFELVV